MSCQQCGSPIAPGEEEIVSRNVPIRPGGKYPYTRLESLQLCPECAARRKGLLPFMIWTAVLGIAGFCLLSQLLKLIL